MPPAVVVPGFGPTSLAVARSLEGVGFDVIAIGPRGPSHKSPLLHSRAPRRKIVLDSGASIVDALETLGRELPDRPPLVLAEDGHVVAVSECRERLAEHYRLLLPPRDLIETLLDKQRFAALARDEGLAVPRSITIHGPDDLPRLREELSFPFVLKPYLLHAQIVHDADELAGYVAGFAPEQWHSVVAQQWIPGGPESLWWCLAYFDERSRAVAHVTGNKVRLWPPGSGNSTICRTAFNDRVTSYSLALLERLGLVGFASLELKYDARDDTYYILEPTVGRCDQQVAITRAAGVNLVEIGVRHLLDEAHESSPRHPVRDGVTLIWDLWDLPARWHPRQDYRGSYLRHLASADFHMTGRISDPAPLLASIGSLTALGMRAVIRRLSPR